MLAHLERNAVDYVICTDMSRLARDHQLFDHLHRRLTARGVRVVQADAHSAATLGGGQAL
jgi:DNA invertase Pin-like site-specific DNA recombinase